MASVSLEKVKLAGELLKKEHEKRLELEKQASQLEKVAADFGDFQRAAKIVFLEIEKGLAEPITSYDDFMSKIASVKEQDMTVIEKAMDLGYNSGFSGGNLVEDESQPREAKNGYELFESFINLSFGKI